jgi:ribosome-binding ATPase
VAFRDLREHGSMAAVRKAGLLRQEGRDYQMQDGDVVEFRFSV